MGKKIDPKNWKPSASGYIPVAMRKMLAEQAAPVVKPVKVETDAEIIAKLTDRFTALEKMTAATITGQNRSTIVSGPPGVGKSYLVEKMLEEAATKDGADVTMIHGYVRPTGLYKTFHEHKFKHSVICFDDSDSIFSDDTSLNILKRACDMTQKRSISWLAETKMLTEEGDKLPRQFDFEGNVIFITNYDFEEMIAAGSKLSPHFEALMSRSHYLDLAMKTNRDRIVRIRQVVGQGMLQQHGFKSEEVKEILDYIEEHSDRLRELSLRMVVKLANLKRIDTNWKVLAKSTCMKVATATHA